MKKSLQKVCKKSPRRRLCRLVQTFEKVCASLPPDVRRPRVHRAERSQSEFQQQPSGVAGRQRQLAPLWSQGRSGWADHKSCRYHDPRRAGPAMLSQLTGQWPSHQASGPNARGRWGRSRTLAQLPLIDSEAAAGPEAGRSGTRTPARAGREHRVITIPATSCFGAGHAHAVSGDLARAGHAEFLH
jgi:hypothetical protein